MLRDNPPVSPLECHQAWADEWNDFRETDLAAIASAMRRGMLRQTVPPVVLQFEREFARFTGARFGISFCNGTSAIYTALRAAGVGPGDEVLAADYGFHGMAAAVLSIGARVVPCDIEPNSLCFDPKEILSARTESTKAVLVHNPWGMPAHWHELRRYADAAGLTLIADGSHAHGALYHGQPLGAWADITCYSLGLRKLISGGELGCAVTSSPVLRDRMLLYAHTNRVPDDLAVVEWRGNAIGLKARAHPLAATLALEQLNRFPEKLLRLRETCGNLEANFERLDLRSQTAPWAAERVYWRLVLRPGAPLRQRLPLSAIERLLRESGVPVEPNHYNPLLQDQKLFDWPDHAGLLRRRPCPIAAETASQLITLPAPAQVDFEKIKVSIDRFEGKLKNRLRH